jgi:hypothetical protein
MTAKVEAAIAQKADAEQELLKLPGVNAVDVGYKYVNGEKTDEIAIRVHVSKKKRGLAENEKIPDEINGIKTDVIEGTYDAQTATKEMVLDVDTQADTVKYRPLQGGISIGPNRAVGGSIYAGTLGCFVRDNATGKTLMLSNFHVMCIDNTWHAGDVMNQPSLIDTGTSADAVGTLNRAVLSTHVDGAVANINASISYKSTLPGIGNINGTSTAVLGAAVRKRGRTTLLTYGNIDGLNGTVNVNYGAALGTRTFTNQIFIKANTSKNPLFSDHGDSGSAIVDANNRVVALLFAGSGTRTIANPIAFVQAELNVTILAKPSKEKLEKLEHKEVKEVKEVKELKLEKAELKEHKLELKEHKEILIDNKHLIKEIEHKVPEVPGPINPPDPITHQQYSSDLEQRIFQLESMVTNLTSFIDSSLRPDLSNGALTNEE